MTTALAFLDALADACLTVPGFNTVGPRSAQGRTVSVHETTCEVEFTGYVFESKPKAAAVVRLWVGYDTTPGAQKRMAEAVWAVVEAIADETSAEFISVVTDVTEATQGNPSFQTAEISVQES